MGGACSGRLDGWAQSWADVGGVSPGVQVPGRENGGNCDIKNLSRGCAHRIPLAADLTTDRFPLTADSHLQ